MLVPFSFMKTTFVSTPVATAATGVGETSFTANWNAFVGASYYLLDVSTSSSFSSFVGSYQNFVVISNSQVVSGLTSNTTYYYRLRAATGVDADAASFFSRVYTAGGALSYTEVSATETLVASLKANSLWTSMKAVYPMVGASAAACAQNLKSSSFTGTFSSGWTFASTGVTGNGTSAFFDTNLNQSGNLTPSNNHISVYSRTNFNGSTGFSPQDCGITNNISYSFQIISPRSNNLALYENGTHLISVSNTNSQGLFIGTSTSSTSAKFYKNGSSIGTSTATQTRTMFANNVYFGASNVSTTNSPAYFSARENAFASIGDGLTDTQSLNLYTAVQTFNQTLNRQVGAQIVSDADAQAYINRVYTAGGTLTNTEANAVNQLTIDMKAAGIWTAMKAVYPMVGSSAAACAQNLKSSSFTGTFSSGWTFSSSGVNGNGVSAYFNTTFNPNTQLTFTDSHISIYKNLGTISATDKANGVYDIGANPIDFSLNPDRNTTLYSQGTIGSYSPDSSVGGSSSVQGNGFYVVARNANNFIRLTKNNTNTLTNTATSSPAALPNDNIWLGASHQVGLTVVVVPNDYRYAFMSMGNYLDATQASNFYTAVQTFNQTLNRQV